MDNGPSSPNWKTAIRIFGSFCLLILSPATAQAQPAIEEEPPSLMDWIMEKEEVNLYLESDFKFFKEERRQQAYQPAIISIKEDGTDLAWEVEIRPRGKFRCMKCEIPPIKLKFSKKKLKNAGYPKWNEFKLVLPCQSGEKYEQWIAKEYLAYKLYNQLTDESYRVKWVNLYLECTSTGEKTSLPAFLIEHREEVAGRLNSEELDSMGINPKAFAADAYTRFQVFQYMIGNTDWIPPVQHNVDLLQQADGRIIPLPFDFDFSGLVNTDYAVPNANTNLPHVRSRFFMGNDMDENRLNAVLDTFKAKQEALMDLVENCELLPKRERKKILRYLDSFFDTIRDSDEVQAEFLNRDPFMTNVY